MQQLTAVAAHVERTGRLPSASRNADPQERPLGVWLTNQRRDHLIGSMPVDRVARLDALVPTWAGKSGPRRDR
ncbi:helicase associated domain-containing protein [Nakamurella alba]